MVYSGPDYNNGLIIYPIRRSFSDSHDVVDSRYLLLYDSGCFSLLYDGTFSFSSTTQAQTV
jgi:hypothetical protein